METRNCRKRRMENVVNKKEKWRGVCVGKIVW